MTRRVDGTTSGGKVLDLRRVNGGHIPPAPEVSQSLSRARRPRR